MTCGRMFPFSTKQKENMVKVTRNNEADGANFGTKYQCYQPSISLPIGVETSASKNALGWPRMTEWSSVIDDTRN